jgi:hypothetical protein
MEQQVGRVDRVGSLSRRVKKPVLVGYAWTPGTYEEYMAQKVRDRVAMIRVLLGAGEWLGDSPETQTHVDKLEEYELDLSP